MRLDVRRRTTNASLGALGALVFGALGGTASAAVLTVTAGCYVVAGENAPPMRYDGSGYTPGDTVLVSTKDGTVDTIVKADAHGVISGRAEAPTPYFPGPGVIKIALVAKDQPRTGATITASTIVNITELAWEHGSTKRQPGLRALTEKTNWSFSGFEPGKMIYGHYLYNDKQVALATFGLAAAPCGTLQVRARLYPATPHHSSYSIQYDDSQPYTKTAQPRIIGPLKLTL
jgi:hypothetical protein